MEQRTFGKTGFQASILALGGCGLGWLHAKEESVEKAQIIADKAIEEALNSGINIFDIAPSYGDSELRLRPWIDKYRNKIFLAEKTMERSKEGAWTELNQSLERLGTDYFDLYQFHAVKNMEDLNTILGKDGALEAFKEAKETDLIRNIGITGHDDIQVLIKALDSFDDFVTVLCPVYVAAMAHPHVVNDFRPLLKVAIEREIGVTAIKAISKGRWPGEQSYQTWYEPFDKQEWIDRAVWFTLSQEGVSTYSLPCDLKLWPLVIDSVKRFRKLEKEEQDDITNLVKSHSINPLFPVDN